MKSTAQVVIVGGGVVGVGILYGLAKRGCADAVLCEQHELTSGSTWHAAGLVQKYIHDRFRARIVSKSIEIYESLEEETGQAVGWHRCGSLRIASTGDRVDEFRKYMDRCETLGLPAEWITPEQAIEHWPLIARKDRIRAAVWNPDDGHVAPADVTMSLAAGARALGAGIYRETKVTGLARTTGGEWEVTTSKGAIRCEHVVLASGMYARETSSALLDLDIPAVPIVHQYMVSDPIPALAERKRQGRPELPVLKADMINGYVREERGGLLFGPYEDGDDLELFGVDGVPEGFAGALLPELLGPIEGHIEELLDMVPAYGEVGIRSNVRGPINLAPDGQPLLGPAPGYDNVWLAEGFTGGPTMGGGVGYYFSEWILEGEPGMDFVHTDPAPVRTVGDQALRLRAQPGAVRRQLRHPLPRLPDEDGPGHQTFPGTRRVHRRRRGVGERSRLGAAGVVCAPRCRAGRSLQLPARELVPPRRRGMPCGARGGRPDEPLASREVRGQRPRRRGVPRSFLREPAAAGARACPALPPPDGQGRHRGGVHRDPAW